MLVSRRTALAMGAAGLIASACRDVTPDHLRAISVRMKWFFAGTMTFWFYGQKIGAFSSQNLDLKIEPGGPENNAVRLVAAGTDTFGISGAEELLLARQKGIPVVAIGTLFQHTPVSFVSHRNSGITTPSDWTGKTIEVLSGNSEEIQYKALKRKFQVTKVREVPYQFNLVPFLSRKVDVSIAYSMDQAVILRRRGHQINEMRAMDYGVDPYGDVLITHEKTFRDEPLLVAAFVKAARAAVIGAAANRAAAIQALTGAAPQLAAGPGAVADVRAVWDATLPFITGPDTPPLSMTIERWTETKSLLKEFGFLQQDVDLGSAIRRVV